MSSDTTRPPFPTYLLPSFNNPLRPFNIRRRYSSTTSTASSLFSAPSFSTSPVSPAWSPNTSPSSSPPGQGGGYFSLHPRSSVSTSNAQEELDCGDKRAGIDISLGRRLARTHPDTLKCSSCATDIAFVSQIVSKGFTGRHGRAYLVSAPPISQAQTRKAEEQQNEKEKNTVGDLVNIKVGRPVSRQLVTGAHVVADISCLVCGQVVGWKYVDAKEAGQRYKIGKFILETRRVVGGKMWEDVEVEWEGDGWVEEKVEVERRGVDFDSEDEDECEDLFTGVWDAETVRKRRMRRVSAKQKADF